MRLFVALNLPAKVRNALHAATAPLRDAAPGARWTPPEKLHLTLEFLGERTDDGVAPLTTALDAIAARHRAIILELRGVGSFPSLRRPRVVWIGVAASAPLAQLQRDVGDACESLGIPRDRRPFHAHVTLARMTPRTPRAETEALARVAPSIEVNVLATARTLDLVQSVSGRYVALHEAAFS